MSGYRITLLAENTAKGRGILGEHGLAYWIETPGGKVLFDTGQGLVLEHNAKRCGIRLEEASAVVLSHGHYDHTGGLEAFLERAPGVPVYLHPDALKKHFSGRPQGGTNPASMPFLHDGGLAKRAERLVYTTEPTPVPGGLWATGEVPRRTDYEDTGGAFYLDAEGLEVDPIHDDMSLFFDTAQGRVLILGCTHAGVVNTMRHVTGLNGGRNLHAVIGGMHLLNADEDRLNRTYAEFRELGVEMMAPCHCTGSRAIAGFRCHFPDRFEEAYASRSFRF